MNLDTWNEHSVATAKLPDQATEPNDCFTEDLGDTCASCEPLTTFPSVSIREDHEVVRIITELPGVDADELDIAVDGATLTLRVHRKPASPAFRVERGYQSFLCRIALPSAVDRDRGEVLLESGVFSLTLPKLEPEPAQTIRLTLNDVRPQL